MPSKSRAVAALALLLLASAPVQAGPIGDMFARHRAAKQMQAKPAKSSPSPFHGRGVGGEMTPSTFQRFQNRFAVKPKSRPAGASGAAQTVFSADRDSAVSRTSR